MRRVFAQGTAADIKRTLEDSEEDNVIMIQPSTSVVVLEDLNVPDGTVIKFDCRLSAMDLRMSGMSASHAVSIFNCVVMLPSEVRPVRICRVPKTHGASSIHQCATHPPDCVMATAPLGHRPQTVYRVEQIRSDAHKYINSG